jgi:hypothetical protein
MGTYAFRINCMLAGGHIETREREIPIALPAPTPPIRMYLPEPQNRTEHPFLTLWGGGFLSEAEAGSAGTAVKTAVMLTGLFLGVGIDVGTDQVLSPALQRKDGQPDARFQPHVHGLQIVPEIDGMLFGGIRVRRVVTVFSTGDFADKVAASYALGRSSARSKSWRHSSTPSRTSTHPTPRDSSR